MTVTFEELKEKLKDKDEVSLMEDLLITSDDLVERFEDRIEDRYDILIEEYEEVSSERD